MNEAVRHLLLPGLLVLLGLLVALWGYTRLPQFGRTPDGDHLLDLHASSHYQDGAFVNQEPTDVLTKDASTLSVILSGILNKAPNLKPLHPLPVVKTDIKALNPNEDLVIWLGHSSFYVQLAGRRILIDPVFSRDAAPMPYINTSFDSNYHYQAEDFPAIDYLLITHDHWDHLDYPSIQALKNQVDKVICGLGVGSHLRHWGYGAVQILEGDWFDTISAGKGLDIHVLPARHFSGRLLTKNQTLWAGFALISPHYKLFFSGDSGYGNHFSEIGRRFGGFDLVALDSGQYDARWKDIHMNPDNAVRAAEDLQARALLPAHVAKFALANHAWDEPLTRMQTLTARHDMRLLTPLMGQVIALAAPPVSTAWWQPSSSSDMPVTMTRHHLNPVE
ncbi:MBL fold metallo-hydrolase [Aeromonas bivalvium]|uniref:MBL fold metallo-hydrolase n=1 Tax=Aeromonas bivalvium TaxID=440079 RepID=UPI0038CF67AF